MKISDIATGKTTLEALFEKKRVQKDSGSRSAGLENIKPGDGYIKSKSVAPDQSRISELENSFMRNSITLQGLNDMNRTVSVFEKTPGADYNSLSSDLSAIVSARRHNGESVLSYLSTNIRDEKDLYTFKASLDSEVKGVSAKLRDERNKIASFLVMSENRETVQDFSPERTAKAVVSMLSRDNAQSLYKGMSNLGNLMGLGK